MDAAGQADFLLFPSALPVDFVDPDAGLGVFYGEAPLEASFFDEGSFDELSLEAAASDELSLESDLESLAPGFGPAYRSEYHPPPLREKLVWLMSFSTFLDPHFGQVRIGLSDIFCHSSNRCPHAPQAYS